MATVLLLLTVLVFPFASAAKGAETTSSSSQTDSKAYTLLAEMMELEVLDYLRSGALVIGLLTAAFSGRDTWLLADAILNCGFGFGVFFFPEQMLNITSTGSKDTFHLFLAQTIGLMQIWTGLVAYSVRRSKNNTVSMEFVSLRCLIGMVALMSFVHEYFKAYPEKSKWKVQFLIYNCVGAALVIFGMGYQSYKHGGPFRFEYDNSDKVTSHLHFDGSLNMILGLMNFGYPELALSFSNVGTMDPIHVMLVRTFGLWSFFKGMYTAVSAAFTTNVDAKEPMRASIIFYTVFTILFGLYQWKHQLLPVRLAYAELGLCAVALGNVAVGYCYPLGVMDKIKEKLS